MQTNRLGFGQALANLIEARRAQSRFQLVLITHDEAWKFIVLANAPLR